MAEDKPPVQMLPITGVYDKDMRITASREDAHYVDIYGEDGIQLFKISEMSDEGKRAVMYFLNGSKE